MKLEAKMQSGQLLGFIESKYDGVNEAALNILTPYFPVEGINGIDFTYVKGGKGLVELTMPSSWDAEPIAQERDSAQMQNGELPIFRRKMSLSEKEIQLLENAVAQANLYRNPDIYLKTLSTIYNDASKLYDGAIATQEYLRAKTLIDGKILFKAGGSVVNADYGVPAGHKETLTGGDMWTDPTAPILDHITEWKETIYTDTGKVCTKMLINNETWKLIKANDQVQANLLPVGILMGAPVGNSIAFKDSQIMQSVLSFTGLTEIIVYDRKAKFAGTEVKYIDNYKVSLFPDETLGSTLVGTSPAERSARTNKNQDTAVSGENIAITILADNNGAPYTQSTEVEFVGLPSFELSDCVFLATVA